MALQDLLDIVPAGSEERSLVDAIDWTRLPRHVAVIMDGNGRWAKLRHKRRVEGHRAGIDSVRDVVETSARVGLEVLTLYAFSVENWKRPPTEVSTLMGLLKHYLRRELTTLLRNNIRFQVLG
ncbi:MAG TPA: polyprenyl diphosphate synthase, partial [Vicinamibacteria bacterium]|nr:polyprenyl diphosphate synthase [Vicinamibacteria bacterium]